MNRNKVRIFGCTIAKVTADTVPWGDAPSIAEHKLRLMPPGLWSPEPDDITVAAARKDTSSPGSCFKTRPGETTMPSQGHRLKHGKGFIHEATSKEVISATIFCCDLCCCWGTPSCIFPIDFSGTTDKVSGNVLSSF